MDEKITAETAELVNEFYVVRKMFLAGESMHVENFVKFYTEDAHYQFGNFPVVHGPQEIVDASAGFIAAVGAVDHHIQSMWEPEPGVVIVEMNVSYTRKKDGKVVTLPCADTIRIKGDKVQELRIYMDINPVFAD